MKGGGIVTGNKNYKEHGNTSNFLLDSISAEERKTLDPFIERVRVEKQQTLAQLETRIEYDRWFYFLSTKTRRS
jgi:uncharacterized protein YjcR